jgi:uncharacterized protein (TIGR02118 family)
LIRVLAFIRRRADVSRDAFRCHYEEVHVPTALPTLGGVVHYVRQHIREEIFGAPGFDCMTSFEYRDAAAVRAAFERIEGPQGDAIRRDELRFMDKPANVFFAVEEATAWEATPARAERARLVVCVRRPEGEEPASFRARFSNDGLPALCTAVEDADWCRPQWARPGVAQGIGFDAVTEIGAGGAGELARWASELEAKGAHVIAVRVSLHETRMPD